MYVEFLEGFEGKWELTNPVGQYTCLEIQSQSLIDALRLELKEVRPITLPRGLVSL